MKKLLVILAITGLTFMSCEKIDDKSFVWDYPQDEEIDLSTSEKSRGVITHVKRHISQRYYTLDADTTSHVDVTLGKISGITFTTNSNDPQSRHIWSIYRYNIVSNKYVGYKVHDTSYKGQNANPMGFNIIDLEKGTYKVVIRSYINMTLADSLVYDNYEIKQQTTYDYYDFKVDTLIVTPVSKFLAHDGKIQIIISNFYAIMPFTYKLYDSNNQLIETNTTTDRDITITDLDKGIYTIKITDSGVYKNEANAYMYKFRVEYPTGLYDDSNLLSFDATTFTGSLKQLIVNKINVIDGALLNNYNLDKKIEDLTVSFVYRFHKDNPNIYTATNHTLKRSIIRVLFGVKEYNDIEEHFIQIFSKTNAVGNDFIGIKYRHRRDNTTDSFTENFIPLEYNKDYVFTIIYSDGYMTATIKDLQKNTLYTNTIISSKRSYYYLDNNHTSRPKAEIRLSNILEYLEPWSIRGADYSPKGVYSNISIFKEGFSESDINNYITNLNK